MSPSERPSFHPSDDGILDLVAGLLDEKARESLLGHFTSCAPCEDRFRKMAAEWERGRARIPAELCVPVCVELAAAASVAAEGGLKGGPRDLRRPSSWRRGRSGGLVAVGVTGFLIVVISVRSTHRGRHGEGLEFAPLPNCEELVVTRGGGAGGDARGWHAGLVAYAEGDMTKASALLASGGAADRCQSMRLLYLASSLGFTGRYSEGLRALEGVEEAALPEPWRSESRWTRHLLLRGSGEAASADSLLAILAGEEGEVGERARRWPDSAGRPHP